MDHRSKKSALQKLLRPIYIKNLKIFRNCITIKNKIRTFLRTSTCSKVILFYNIFYEDLNIANCNIIDLLCLKRDVFMFESIYSQEMAALTKYRGY